MMNKKGSLTGVLDNYQFIFTIIMVLVIAIGVLWGMFTLGPIMAGEGTQAVSAIKNDLQSTDANNTEFSNATIVGADLTTSIIGKMEFLVYAVFLGCFIGFLIIGYEVKFYPYLSFVWIGLMIVVAFFSIIVSNAYQEDAANEITSSYFATWGSSGWVMSNLPYIVVSLGMISGILLFIMSSRQPDEEMTTGSVNI